MLASASFKNVIRGTDKAGGNVLMRAATRGTATVGGWQSPA